MVLRIRDQHGCELDTTIMLIEENGLPLLSAQVVDASCLLDNGQVIIHTGEGEIEFALAGHPFQVDSVFTGLAAGPYDIIAQNSA